MKKIVTSLLFLLLFFSGCARVEVVPPARAEAPVVAQKNESGISEMVSAKLGFRLRDKSDSTPSLMRGGYDFFYQKEHK